MQIFDQRTKVGQGKIYIINVHQIYNIPNRGRDKGPITREVQSNKRKGNIKFYKNYIPL